VNGFLLLAVRSWLLQEYWMTEDTASIRESIILFSLTFREKFFNVRYVARQWRRRADKKAITEIHLL